MDNGPAPRAFFKMIPQNYSGTGQPPETMNLLLHIHTVWYAVLNIELSLNLQEEILQSSSSTTLVPHYQKNLSESR